MFGSILFQSSFSHEDCIIYHLTIRLLAFFFYKERSSNFENDTVKELNIPGTDIKEKN